MLASEIKARATSFAKIPIGFPAYLVLEINGGHKLKNLAKYFGEFDQRVESFCPFAGGYADMSVQSKSSGYVRVKANLRLRNSQITVRVDNAHGGFHLDVETNKMKLQEPRPVVLASDQPTLLAAFDIARRELLSRGAQHLPKFGSIEEPTLGMLRRIWAATYFVNNTKVEMLLPPYPGSKLTCRIYTLSQSPFRLEPLGIDLTGLPFQWEGHQ